MLASLVVLAIVVVSGAIVVRIVLVDDPGATTPPRPASPRSRTSAGPALSRPWWRRETRCFVEIFALCGFVVAQPVLGSFGESPETFVATDASARTIVAFGVAVVLVPALALWGLAAVTGLAGARVRRVAQSAVVGLLVGLFVSWSIRQLLPGGAWTTAAALAAGLVVAVLYDRFASARLYLAFASAAPVVFLVVFLAFSPVANLVFTPEPEPAAAAPSRQPSGQPSVVMVVLDELPTVSLLDGRDRIDGALFPNFARFADDATFYRNTTTVSPITDVALPALLTGRIRPEANAVRADYVENLFTLLGDSHQLNVHEAITSLCPPSRCNQSFDAKAIGDLGYLALDLWTGMVSSSAATSVREGVGEDTFEAFLELLADRFDEIDAFVTSLEPEVDRPHFDFAHLLVPHVPWQQLPDGREYHGDPHPLGLRGPVWTTETAAALGRQRHLLQLQYTDQQLGRVLDRLGELDRYDNSYVIVLADHGVSFRNQDFWRGVSSENAHEVLWAPLLIKAPSQTEGRVTDVNSQIIDVVPTIADAMGLTIGWEVDGRSLLDEAPRDAGDKRFTPHPDQGTIELESGKSYATVKGARGLANMLAAPPGSAVPSEDPLALYRLPPHVELTGTPVDELPRGAPVDWKARLVDGEQYGEVNLEAAAAPVYVSGVVEEADTELRDVVVAVNGVIGGWGHLEMRLAVGVTGFAVLVPDSFLRPGPNTVEVFAIEGPPGAVILRPVELLH